MNSRTIRPSLEPLEGRLTPAGNVSAQVIDGSLVLSGDGEGNAVLVGQSAPGRFTVTPEDGTTLNGASDPLTFTRVPRDLRVLLGEGDDRLRLETESGGPLVVGRDLIVVGGSGDNAIQSFSGLTAGRDFRVANGDGFDQLEVFGAFEARGDVLVTNGDGNSATTISPFSGPGFVGGDLRIVNGVGAHINSVGDLSVRGGVAFVNGANEGEGVTTNFFGASSGDDRVEVGDGVAFLTESGPSNNRLTDTDVGGDVTIAAGPGGESSVEVGSTGRGRGRTATVRGDLTVLVAGPAEVTLGDLAFGTAADLSVRGSLTVGTGDGDDGVTLDSVEVGRDASLRTGGGADVILIDDTRFGGDFRLGAGAGADELIVEGKTSTDFVGPTTDFRGRVEVNLGSDDDRLRLGVAGDPTRVVRLFGPARFGGGDGTDLRDAANVRAAGGRVTFAGFEQEAPPPLLLGPVRYAVGEYVISVTTADVNGDTVPDVITVNQDSETVSVLLGRRDGTFRRARSFEAGERPFGLAVGDFNEDGDLDLAVANDGGADGAVSVLLGNGDGTFQDRVGFPVGDQTSAVRVAVGDVNDDDHLDLVTANRTGNNEASVSVLLGNGDGTFETPPAMQLGQVGGGTDVALGDVNGDNKLDVVATSVRGFAVILGNGDGTFGEPAVEAASPTTGLVLSDLDGDAKTDVVLGGNSLQVRLGNGDGTFDAAAVVLDAGVTGVAVGDFNRDGVPDLAVTHFPDTLSVLLGNGDGSFEAPREFSPGPDEGPVAVADLDGDGFDDVVVGNQEFESVAVFRNSGRVTG